MSPNLARSCRDPSTFTLEHTLLRFHQRGFARDTITMVSHGHRLREAILVAEVALDDDGLRLA